MQKGTAMTIEASTKSDTLKQIYREYIELMWHQRRLDLAERFFTSDTLDHSGPPGQRTGIEGLTETFRMIQAAFPDWRITVDIEVAEGNMLVTRIGTSGTHTGEPFFGIPASGRSFRSTGTHILRFEGGKMAEHWSNADDLGLMMQLGAIQLPGA
jgi:predicted ester cyclase